MATDCIHSYRLCMGSNAPDGRRLIMKATASLRNRFDVVATTPAIKTPSINDNSCLFYFNSGICISSALSHGDLKAVLKQVELDFGRKKGIALVTMDIDIIMMDGTAIHPDYKKQYVRHLMNALASKLSH